MAGVAGIEAGSGVTLDDIKRSDPALGAIFRLEMHPGDPFCLLLFSKGFEGGTGCENGDGI